MSSSNYTLTLGIAVVALPAVLVLASCNGFTIGEPWTLRCSDLPSWDEVQEIMHEYDDFFEELQEKELIWEARIAQLANCSGRASIIIYHGGKWQKPIVLEMMDDIEARSKGDKHFFGVPFRFHRVKEDVFYEVRSPYQSFTL